MDIKENQDFKNIRVVIASSLPELPLINSFVLIKSEQDYTSQALEITLLNKYRFQLPPYLSFGTSSNSVNQVLIAGTIIRDVFLPFVSFETETVEASIKMFCKFSGTPRVLFVQCSNEDDSYDQSAMSRVSLSYTKSFGSRYSLITENTVEEVSEEVFLLRVEDTPTLLCVKDAPAFALSRTNVNFVSILPKWRLFYYNDSKDIKKINIDGVSGLREVLDGYSSLESAGELYVDTLEEQIRPILQQYYMDAQNQQNLALYKGYYNKRLEDFLDYIEFLGDQTSTTLTEESFLKIRYCINEMEIMLLMALQIGLVTHPEWLLRSEGYSFLLSEAFFIALCKENLNIRDEHDFFDSFENKIFSIVKNFLIKIKHDACKILFPTSEKKSMEAVALVHGLHAECHQVLSKAGKISEWLQMFFLGKIHAAKEMDELISLLRPIFKDEEKFLVFFKQLSAAIDYRLSKKKQFASFDKKQEGEYLHKIQTYTQQFAVQTQVSSDRLLCGLDQLSKMDELTEEERNFLRARQQKIQKNNQPFCREIKISALERLTSFEKATWGDLANPEATAHVFKFFDDKTIKEAGYVSKGWRALQLLFFAENKQTIKETDIPKGEEKQLSL